MRKILPLLLVFLTAFAASGKLTKFLVRAYVTKQDYSKISWQKEDLDSVFVALVKNDTVPVSFVMLKGDDDLKMTTDGEVRLLAEGGLDNYTLILNKEGYEPLRHDFKVASEGQDVVYLRTLSMEPKRQTTLNEVTITGTAIKMVMKGDTIVYDSAAFVLPEGSTLDALVSQLPGAQLEADGSITVNGKKVQSLLINGQDFFKGDPDIALKNLPSYTVDKIKVYDKVAKNDYLTNASQTIADYSQNENIVMDVQLKKEFSMATILSVEGGYGPGIYRSEDPKKFDNRYIGRAFIIGFGKNYRFTAFGNVNNIMQTSAASSSNKDWGRNWWQPSGDLDFKMGGMDVFYEPSKKVELSANLQYSREDIFLRSMSSSTSFYPTGNLYSRALSESDDRRDHLIYYANFEYKGDNVYLYFRPWIDWRRSRIKSVSYTANLDRNPAESERGAAIDSIFELKPGVTPSAELIRSVTSSNYRAANGSLSSNPDKLTLSASIGLDWMPKSIRGKFSLNGGVNDQDTESRNGIINLQEIADPAPDYTPLRRSQWNDNRRRNTDANTRIGYSWQKSYFGSTRTHSIDISAETGWEMDRNFSDNVMEYEAHMETLPTGSRPLPSMTAPENMPVDPENTLTSLSLNNSATGSIALSYGNAVTAPGDSALNLNHSFDISFTHEQRFRHLSYSKPRLDPGLYVRMNRNNPLENFAVTYNLSSNNKRHNIYSYIQYTYSQDVVGLLTLVPTRDSSDPLDVYEGPAAGEKFANPVEHYGFFYFYYMGVKTHDSGSLYANYYRRNNATSQTSVFDPATGVTTHRPMSINGNWSVSVSGNYRKPFGPLECWTAEIRANYSHDNSVDYVASVGEPERSLVKSDKFGGRLKISYKIPSGTRFWMEGSGSWQRATSPRPTFTPVSAQDYQAEAGIAFYLPWQIEGETTMRGNFRRGYEDQSLNRSEWVWNASIQKSLLKGALTFKITAVDLLGQLSSVNYYVNAQGRTEKWENSLPRYAMLTVSYRFNFTPNALK